MGRIVETMLPGSARHLKFTARGAVLTAHLKQPPLITFHLR
jgi:hypothetical protein